MVVGVHGASADRLLNPFLLQLLGSVGFKVRVALGVPDVAIFFSIVPLPINFFLVSLPFQKSIVFFQELEILVISLPGGHLRLRHVCLASCKGGGRHRRGLRHERFQRAGSFEEKKRGRLRLTAPSFALRALVVFASVVRPVAVAPIFLFRASRQKLTFKWIHLPSLGGT